MLILIGKQNSQFHEEFWNHFLGLKITSKNLKLRFPLHHETEPLLAFTLHVAGESPAIEWKAQEPSNVWFQLKPAEWNQESWSKQPWLEMKFHKVKLKFHSQGCSKTTGLKVQFLGKPPAGKGGQKEVHKNPKYSPGNTLDSSQHLVTQTLCYQSS